MAGRFDHDVIIAGGGLAGGLIALRLRALRPELNVLVLEGGPVLGGVHTWSCFETDLSPAVRAWIAPLISYRWPGYSVRFPAHGRDLTTPYLSIASDRFARVVGETLGDAARTGTPVVSLTADSVTLADQTVLTAAAVIDARGPSGGDALVLGWQKFLGQEVELTAPHGLTRPIIMDATVDQLDGYRFLYVLPQSPTRLLIEDTRYADGEALDRDELRQDLNRYATDRGWTIGEVLREEDGVLPIALGGDIDRWWDDTEGAAVGLRAALFHPVTGYSLPDAARLADQVATLPVLNTETVRAHVEAHSKATWDKRGYYRLLNRMLFRACEPDQRYRVLERFYRLPQPLIERFYAGQAGLGDKARILIGKPPVPVSAALRVLSESSVLEPTR
ncbi:lycopene beta-cyclase CrtY [Caulobacter sp. SLTY]|uniref:lycopene beta-cyclase CrtY n=1 Tax=Caulobacter sp. SLTY TaxID=2683262 RepID=UPI001411B5B4|nr:lycopene beta-cyclase CrtY [Caulobacter sp. SLTY]NBB17205.1 lycopene beta-cyclase CrtY [Caulobacter sp. SLTY]